MFSHRLSDRAELRILEEYHAQEMFKSIARNREHLDPWLPFVEKLNSVDDVRRFIRFRLDQFAKDGGFLAGIFFDNAFVGGAGFHGIEHQSRKTDIGYWLSADMQGKGLATMAVAALINHAIDLRKVNRIEIRCDTANKKSQRVPERLGFELEGILREADWYRDRPVDHSLYALLAKNWRDRELASKHVTLTNPAGS